MRNEFESLHKEINASRAKYLQVIHGGVLFHNKHSIIFEDLDPNNEFERDPMTKLKVGPCPVLASTLVTSPGRIGRALWQINGKACFVSKPQHL